MFLIVFFYKSSAEKLTAVHLAAENGHWEVLQKLVTFGCTIDDLDKNGESPLHFASRSGHLKCVEILLRNKANFALVSKSKKTPEELARGAGYYVIADCIKAWQVHRMNTPEL